MFTPNQERAASELVRVCRPGGKIGLANWTPESFIGQLFKTVGKYVPPPPGVKSPALWGNKAHLDGLFGRGVERRDAEPALHLPLQVAGALARRLPHLLRTDAQGVRRDRPAAQQALQADILALIDEFNVAKDGTLVIPSEYLEVVITKRPDRRHVERRGRGGSSAAPVLAERGMPK